MFGPTACIAPLVLGLACASANVQKEVLRVGSPHELKFEMRVTGKSAVWASGNSADDFGDLRAVSFAGADQDLSSVESAVFEFEPFDECLVSWNARHSKSTGFGVEVCVARSVDGPFSPWMWIGEWNVSQRPTPLVLDYEDARIDVDTFTSKTTWRALRLRIRCRANDAASAGLLMERVTVMPTLRSARDNPGRAAHAVPRLDVPFKSQRAEDPAIAGRICSPTSLAMVLSWRGVNASTAEVARRAYDPFHGIYGNWNRAIQAAYSFGVPGRLERIGNWARAEELVRGGQPLIVSISAKSGQLHGAPYTSTAGHLLVICGFDAVGNVQVNDPAATDELTGQATYSRAEFESVWLARGGTAYVLEPLRTKAR